jgi:hypothetical protein
MLELLPILGACMLHNGLVSAMILAYACLITPPARFHQCKQLHAASCAWLLYRPHLLLVDQQQVQQPGAVSRAARGPSALM